MRPDRLLRIAAVVAISLISACGSDHGVDQAERLATISIDGDRVTIRNRSNQTIEVAGSVGLEVLEGSEWVDALPLLERLAGTVVASRADIRILAPQEAAVYQIPLYEQLPAGRYRVTAAHNLEEGEPLRQFSRVSFTR